MPRGFLKRRKHTVRVSANLKADAKLSSEGK